MNTTTGETKWYETLTVKMILLGGLVIMLLIPLQLIKMVIRERASYAEGVKGEISAQWGGKQTITGPVLNIPVTRTSLLSDGKTITERDIWHLMPDQLNISGDIKPEIRYKGIYEAVVYNSELLIGGSFILPEAVNDNFTAQWDEAYITFGISDNRGLRDTIILSFGDNSIEAAPGVNDRQLFPAGITFAVPPVIPGETYRFSMDLGLSGSGGIYFAPAGKTTRVSLKSSWKAPSFGGSFLPAERETGDQGFTSDWVVTHLNRNFPQEFTGPNQGLNDNSFGVDLIMEVDHYLKSERSAKYGILFIALTFMVLLFIELTAERKIHIFSYLLVALALVLFFSLLNSLSEVIGFNPSYLISSAATIVLVTLFTGSLVNGRKTLFAIGGMLTLLYAFIFILLSLKQYSYLAGNIGLFIALAVTMRLTARTKIFNRSTI